MCNEYVKPDRETVFAAALGASSVTITDSPYQKAEWLRITDAVLALLPGRSEAEVKAEAWDEGYTAGHVDATDDRDPESPNPYRASEGGADRG